MYVFNRPEREENTKGKDEVTAILLLRIPLRDLLKGGTCTHSGHPVPLRKSGPQGFLRIFAPHHGPVWDNVIMLRSEPLNSHQIINPCDVGK